MTDLQRTRSASVPVPVLLVDDTLANIVALEAVLASPKLELVVARSGRDAVRLVEQRDFAVVLLDVQMPEMDGFETASQLKEITRRGQPLPIIFVTGIDGAPSRVIRAYAEGGVDFIQKPLEPEIIRAKVSVFAELYRARQRLVASQTHAARETARREAAEDGLTYLRAVIDNLPELAWTALPDGCIDYFNQRWFEFTGTTFDEVAGRGSEKVHDPTMLPVVVEQWKRALAARTPFEMELPLRGADGVFRRRTGSEVVVSVSDTGTGIPDDEVAQVFKPYWQADDQRKRGAGLGLSIAKAIVDAHGGRIWVETAVGRGSSFHFTLPATDGKLATQEER